jgi:isoquinoline 1-oxidoreductase beta subunit
MSNSRLIDRRKFIRSTALAAGGLIISFNVPAGGRAGGVVKEPVLFAPNAFLRVGTDNSVKVILSHCEMGQGIWTSLSMLIAEELDADWKSLQVEHAPADMAYYHTVYATQRTGGSTSLNSEFDRYRKAGATARYLLVQAASNRWKVAMNDCKTANGYVISGDKKISYGELVTDAMALPAPADVPLKDPKDWKIIGGKIKRLDTLEKIHGTAVFGMDIQFPDMLTVMVARVPVNDAKVTGYDEAAALAVPGVRQVVKIPTGVAVLADDFWSAKKGRQALKVQWDLGAAANISSDTLLTEMRSRADKGGIVATEEGNAAESFKKSVTKVEVEYFQPFLAQSPMEPLNCTVKLSADKCEIWTGTQTQTDDQHAASEITGLPISQVFIHTCFLGGSFGRRNITRSDFVREAVEVAKASGKLVKTVWTREDDIQGGRYRPAFLHRFKVGLDATGMPVSWDQISVGQSVMTGGPFEKLAVVNGVDVFSIEGMQAVPFVKALKNKKIAVNTPDWPVMIDNWRAVGMSHTIFAMESLIDEMAYAAKKDPVTYRRMLYKDDPRLLNVLNLAVEKSSWGAPLPRDYGRGIAAFKACGSLVALVAEVSVPKNGMVKVHKVTCVVDCGTVIQPDGVVAQMEGSVGYGLSAALYSEITFKNGQVQQKNFYNYPILRMNEMPEVNTYLVPSNEPPGGIGEASVGQMMPALTNAIFSVTGKRIRSLPVYKMKQGIA